MTFITQLLDNPLYLLLFGSGGILIIVLTILFQIKNKYRIPRIAYLKRVGTIITEIIKKTIRSEENKEDHPAKVEPYDLHPFHSDDYYVEFLTSVEEKKKGGDTIEYR